MITNLSLTDLKQVWNLADRGNKGKLSIEEYVLAMILCKHLKNKLTLPVSIHKDFWKNYKNRNQPVTEFQKNSCKDRKVIRLILVWKIRKSLG